MVILVIISALLGTGAGIYKVVQVYFEMITRYSRWTAEVKNDVSSDMVSRESNFMERRKFLWVVNGGEKSKLYDTFHEFFVFKYIPKFCNLF